jgi:hypothetical protein
MVKKTISLVMACFILTGSVIFPLGDFSLTRDLPAMYHNYIKIAEPEELGVMDFIGDYLLHGKELFGHNNKDKAPDATNNVQFQHQASSPNIMIGQHHQTLFIIPYTVLTHPAFIKIFYTSNYQNKLFRPPLA